MGPQLFGTLDGVAEFLMDLLQQVSRMYRDHIHSLAQPELGWLDNISDSVLLQ
jgi:hypothetical protein